MEISWWNQVASPFLGSKGKSMLLSLPLADIRLLHQIQLLTSGCRRLVQDCETTESGLGLNFDYNSDNYKQKNACIIYYFIKQRWLTKKTTLSMTKQIKIVTTSSVSFKMITRRPEVYIWNHPCPERVMGTRLVNLHSGLLGKGSTR